MSQGLQNASYPVSGSIKVSSIFPGDYAACDEGSYFTANLGATASTAVATTTQALGKTNPILAIINQYPVGGPGSFNLYLRYIRVVSTVISGSSTSLYHVGTLDNLNPKLSTVGTSLNAPMNTNSNSGTTSRAQLIAGVNIASADTGLARTIHTGIINNAIPVAIDSWMLTFGDPSSVMSNGVQTVKSLVIPICPVIIAPGWTYTLGVWGPSSAASAATYIWDVGYIERPQGQ